MRGVSQDVVDAILEAQTEAITTYTMESLDQGPGEGNYDRIRQLTAEDIARAVIRVQHDEYRNFVQMIADLGCKGMQTQPYPCDQLPDYDHKLWCVGCLARELLKGKAE